jgi:hypothetical protein
VTPFERVAEHTVAGVSKGGFEITLRLRFHETRTSARLEFRNKEVSLWDRGHFYKCHVLEFSCLSWLQCPETSCFRFVHTYVKVNSCDKNEICTADRRMSALIKIIINADFFIIPCVLCHVSDLTHQKYTPFRHQCM